MYRVLQEVHHSVVAERDSLSTSLARIRGTATPRPEWSRCEGYVEDWSQVSHGRSSDQLVDILLARISGKTVEEIAALSTFPGQVRGGGRRREGGWEVMVCASLQGLGEGVPRYLRWEGEVPNHRFSQRQVNTLINGFWKYILTSDLKPLAVSHCDLTPQYSLCLLNLQPALCIYVVCPVSYPYQAPYYYVISVLSSIMWYHGLCTVYHVYTLHPILHQIDEGVWEYLLSLHEGSEERAVEDAYNLQVSLVM